MPKLSTTTWAIIIAIVLVVVAGGGTAIVIYNDRQKFLKMIGDEVIRQLSELRPDMTDQQRAESAAIVAAQAAFETDYGRTPAWIQGYNFGNVTAGIGWRGEIVGGGDTEYDAAGNVKTITQAFRKYGSLAEAMSDFLGNVLRWAAERNANALPNLIAGDLEAYLRSLSTAHYYTLPVDQYIAGVKAEIDSARGVLS